MAHIGVQYEENKQTSCLLAQPMADLTPDTP